MTCINQGSNMSDSSAKETRIKRTPSLGKVGLFAAMRCGRGAL